MDFTLCGARWFGGSDVVEVAAAVLVMVMVVVVLATCCFLGAVIPTAGACERWVSRQRSSVPPTGIDRRTDTCTDSFGLLLRAQLRCEIHRCDHARGGHAADSWPKIMKCSRLADREHSESHEVLC